MSQNAPEYLGQFYGVAPNPSFGRKRRATSEFLKGIFKRRNRLQRSHNTFVDTTIVASSVYARRKAGTKGITIFDPYAKALVDALNGFIGSLFTEFSDFLYNIFQYSEQIKQSPFYCCSVEYAKRLAAGAEGRAPLFVISESPTEPIVKPCREPECPIAAGHNEGPYWYLGKEVPLWLQEELDREFTAGARHIFGQSNPHPLIWLAFWRSSLNFATKAEHFMVKKFMECHGLLGNGPANAEQSKAYELWQSLSFGALSPASSTNSPN